MNEDSAKYIATAIERFVIELAALERQILIADMEGLIKDYRGRQPNYQDAKGKADQAYRVLVKTLVEETA